jgi:tRNA uridine 5-carbamoylmethylation protein Kti12
MSPFDDDVLRQMYREYDTPADTLVSDPTLLQEFAQKYATRTGEAVKLAAIGHRLLHLRKLGEANGGLSRLRRRFNGRN